MVCRRGDKPLIPAVVYVAMSDCVRQASINHAVIKKMSNNYYYFAASLPLIFFDSKPPLTTEVFIEQCKRFLSEGDFFLVSELMAPNTDGIATNNRFVNKWLKFEKDCCNEMACFRAERDKKDPAEYLRGERIVDPEIIGLINHASKMENLLEAQRSIDQAKWKFLEDMSLRHYFDLEFIISYALKLKMLNRYQLIYSEKGKERFEEFKKVEIPG